MATSDSEAFESADEDFDFDIDSHGSSAPHRKTGGSNHEVVSMQKPSGDSLVAKEREKSESSQLSEEKKDTIKLEDSLKSLDIGETVFQVKDDSKATSAGDKSDSSDSDGGGDSVRTLKGDSRPKQDCVIAAPIENELIGTNTPTKDSSVLSGIDPDNVQTKASSEIDTDTDNTRSNSRGRKHEKKRPQTTREPKQKNSVKKLGTKITPKSVTHMSVSGNKSDSIVSSNEYEENLLSDNLANAKEPEEFLESMSTEADATISTATPSGKNEEKISSVLEKLAETSHGKVVDGEDGVTGVFLLSCQLLQRVYQL